MIDDAEGGVPRLMGISDVAKHLHKSKRWLQYFLKDNPFGRMAGRTRLFTEADLAALIESLPKPLGLSGLPASVAASETALLARLEKLRAEGEEEGTRSTATGGRAAAEGRRSDK
jgi:hypothetical protein